MTKRAAQTCPIGPQTMWDWPKLYDRCVRGFRPLVASSVQRSFVMCLPMCLCSLRNKTVHIREHSCLLHVCCRVFFLFNDTCLSFHFPNAFVSHEESSHADLQIAKRAETARSTSPRGL